MRRIGVLVILGTVLVGLSLLWNTFAADAPPGPDDDSMLRLVEHRLNWTSLLTSIQPPLMNTPAPPVTEAGLTLKGLPSAGTGVEAGPVAPSFDDAQEIRSEFGRLSSRSRELVGTARPGEVPINVHNHPMRSSAHAAPHSTSEERCVQVLLNPEVHVVEFGDDTGSIEHWTVLMPQVCYVPDPDNALIGDYYLEMSDGPCGAAEDTGRVEINGEIWDLDAFGQGFWTPPDLTYLAVMFGSVSINPNAIDYAVSTLWTLTSDHYLDQLVDYAYVPDNTADWAMWYWELPTSLLHQVSGKPLAVLYQHYGNLKSPHQFVYLDNLNVVLCYEWEPPTSAVYLPLVRRDPPADPGPRCIPREPDSLENPGFTTVNATCHSSFSALDQRDYYTLDLRGASNVQLRLFDLPSGTNWDAMIYENAAGYPLACHIGTPGHEDKWKDCSLDPGKTYFVMVNRGPGTTGGPYKLRVDRR